MSRNPINYTGSSVNRDTSSHTEYRIILLSVQYASSILPIRSRATREFTPPQPRRLRVNWNPLYCRPSHVTLRYKLFGYLRETDQGQGRLFRMEERLVSANIIYERFDAPAFFHPRFTYQLLSSEISKIWIVSLILPHRRLLEIPKKRNIEASWIYDEICREKKRRHERQLDFARIIISIMNESRSGGFPP